MTVQILWTILVDTAVYIGGNLWHEERENIDMVVETWTETP